MAAQKQPPRELAASRGAVSLRRGWLARRRRRLPLAELGVDSPPLPDVQDKLLFSVVDNRDQTRHLGDDLVSSVACERIVRFATPVDANDMGSAHGRPHQARHDVPEVADVKVIRDLTEDDEVEWSRRPLLRNGAFLEPDM